MGKLSLYYMAGSPPCRAVWMCIKELGLDVEIIKIDMYQKADHKQPWFVQMNPQHTVPTIKDDEFVLWESRAIMGYLVNKYGKDDRMYPRDPQRRAMVDRMLYFDSGTLYRSIADFFQPMLMGSEADPLKANALKQNLDYLDLFLSQQQYAAGDDLTIADLSLLPIINQLEAIEYNLKPYVNVDRWYQKIKSELPYYTECNKEGLELFQAWAKAKMAAKT